MHTEFELNLKKQSFENFLRFKAYQVFHYMLEVNATKLSKCVLSFVRDASDNYFLVDCQQLAIVDTSGVRSQQFFQHYLKNYTLEQQEQIIAQFNSILLSEKEQMGQVNEEHARAQSRRLASLMDVMLDNNLQLRAMYLESIENQLEAIEDHEQKQKSNEIYTQINNGTRKNLQQLIKSHEGTNHVERIREKKHLLNNFPEHRNRFLQNLQTQLQTGQLVQKKASNTQPMTPHKHRSLDRNSSSTTQTHQSVHLEADSAQLRPASGMGKQRSYLRSCQASSERGKPFDQRSTQSQNFLSSTRFTKSSSQQHLQQADRSSGQLLFRSASASK